MAVEKNPELEMMAKNIANTGEELAKAEELIRILRAAGEDTTDMTNALEKTRVRRQRWVNALKEAGYSA